MYKYSFLNDYSEGAHPRILEALTRTNMLQEAGYGEDQFSLEAVRLIRKLIERPDADIHLISGGTQTNLTALSAMLRPYESIIAVDSAHICVHETGAIEATGHKINLAAGENGKISAPAIEEVVIAHGDEHMVSPRVVFISQSTELGTIYSKQELKDIAAICKKYNLYLYLDGARLGSGLTSESSDINIKELAALVDVFYIGGTKNGALLGEALVINHPQIKPRFRYFLKQRGALLSKGRILGVQFTELFKDGLYFELARHANQMAQKLTHEITSLGFGFQTNSPSNQIFPIFPNQVIESLNKEYRFYTWSKIDADHTSVRLVTSWATPPEAIDRFISDLAKLA
ncbi:MAG: low specificity L-threonine aldolase [Anaerolineae bacterium]|nr:low specificity L-threonine aldolase [Anaerolineae bacterium]